MFRVADPSRCNYCLVYSSVNSTFYFSEIGLFASRNFTAVSRSLLYYVTSLLIQNMGYNFSFFENIFVVRSRAYKGRWLPSVVWSTDFFFSGFEISIIKT